MPINIITRMYRRFVRIDIVVNPDTKPLITCYERTSRDAAKATERPATPAAARSGVIDRDDGEDRIVAPVLKLTRGAARDAKRRTLEANMVVGGSFCKCREVQIEWLSQEPEVLKDSKSKNQRAMTELGVEDSVFDVDYDTINV